MLPKGYVPGDRTGNAFFAAHVLLAAAIAFGGTLQLIPRLRARVPAFHRWNGRIFLTTALAASASGLVLTWVRGSSSLLGSLSITVDALLIVSFAVLAWRAARARETARHRRWALRTFVVSNAVWFQRMGFATWLIVNQGPVAMGTFHRLWQWGCFLLPLGMLELYLRARDGRSASWKFAAAGTLTILTVLLGIGVAGFYALFMRPILTGA